ncbi:MAG: hypothetical protein DI569_06815 [Sphingopyxis macrogoltabida]|uniref:Uncharacterized protein n=1 Tax=Sphingopyxis macrogoltabida TaxID=33050 RepID=A0A2W5MYE0_SPHMC|nr:MAG: hypothetical protein DI569_06815 [Sphingopyxis macrogoltabida]
MDRVKANEAPIAGDTDRIIAGELDSLLGSPMFMRSPVLSRLLQFLVDHRLRGARAAPKAYAIATEALGRSADFDPAVDSYPRVMVGRLRALLDRYYAETPWVHRLRVPQGSYEVVVQYRTSPPARVAAEGGAEVAAPPSPATPAAPAGRSPAWSAYASWLAIFALAMLAIFAASWSLSNSVRPFAGRVVPPPLIEVSPPAAGETGVSRALARAIDGKLRDGLRRFDMVELLSARSPGGGASDSRGDYRLDTSLVRTTEGIVDVTLMLNRVSDQRTIWSEQLRLNQAQVPEFHEIEPAIAQIAGDYGVVARDQIQRQPDSFARGYPCFVQFQRLRQMRSAGSAEKVDRCLRESIEQNPRDVPLLAALSLLRYGDWQPQRGSAEGQTAYAEARSFAERAYAASPRSAAGLFAMARANFFAGDCGGGNAMGDAALRLNPYDADMTGFLGLYKVACGQREVGEPLLQRSLQLDSSYPGVPAVTLAYLLSDRGEQDRAQDILDAMPSPSNLEPQHMAVQAIILARRGNMAAARQQWQRLVAYTRQRPTAAPEEVLRQFMITPVVINRMASTVRDVGIITAPPAR